MKKKSIQKEVLEMLVMQDLNFTLLQYYYIINKDS